MAKLRYLWAALLVAISLAVDAQEVKINKVEVTEWHSEDPIEGNIIFKRKYIVFKSGVLNSKFKIKQAVRVSSWEMKYYCTDVMKDKCTIIITPREFKLIYPSSIYTFHYE